MKRRLAWLGLLSLLLAGCVAPGAPAEGAATPAATMAPAVAEPPRHVMLQTGCSSFYSSHAVDVAYAEARLPEGLAPYEYGDTGAALLTLKSWTCPDSEVDNATIPSGAAIVYYIAVTPEARYDAEHVGFSWYPLEIVTATPALADAFRAWGFEVAAPGEVAITWNEGADPWVVRVAAQGRASVDATLTIPSYASEDGSFTVRYFAGDGERVTSAVDIVVHGGSRGGSGPTLLRLDGEHAPSPAPLVGASAYQGWDDDALSYTWTPVAFAS